MSRPRLSASVVAGLAAVLALSGCAAPEAEEPAAGGDEIVALDAEATSALLADVDGMDPVVVPESAHAFGVVLYGSSGCPPVPQSVTTVEAGLELELALYPADVACTADYAPAGYRVSSTAELDWASLRVWVCSEQTGARSCDELAIAGR